MYRWAFLHGSVVLTFVWMTLAMSVVYCTVLKQERSLDRFKVEGERSQRKNSRNIANQALFYVVAFAIPWTWGLILFSIDNPAHIVASESYDNALTALSVANAVLFPLQVCMEAAISFRESI
jgi:hypothetical protein